MKQGPGLFQLQEQMCTFQWTLQGQMNTLVAWMVSAHPSVALATAHVPEHPLASLLAPLGLGTPAPEFGIIHSLYPPIEERTLAHCLLAAVSQEFAARPCPSITHLGSLATARLMEVTCQLFTLAIVLRLTYLPGVANAEA